MIIICFASEYNDTLSLNKTRHLIAVKILDILYYHRVKSFKQQRSGCNVSTDNFGPRQNRTIVKFSTDYLRKFIGFLTSIEGSASSRLLRTLTTRCISENSQ